MAMKYLLPTDFDPRNKKHISRLQDALAKAVRPNIIGADGPTIGKATRDAIKAFQKRHKITDTGRPNRAFLNALDEELLARQWSRPAHVKKLHQQIVSAAKAGGIAVDLGAEIRSRTIGADTRRAISALESFAGIRPKGDPTPAVVREIATIAAGGRKREPSYLLARSFDSTDPKHVVQLQRALEELATPDFTTAISKELEKVESGEILRTQARFGLERTGRLDDATIVAIKTTEEIKKAQHRLKTRAKTGNPDKSTIDALNQEIIDRRFSTKTQVKELHTKIKIASRNAGLGRLDLGADLRRRSLGGPTKAALLRLQEKYGLRATGALDVETIELIESIVASRARPSRVMPKPGFDELGLVRHPLRLNMRRPSVRNAQKALVWSGHALAEREFNTGAYGATTREAVKAFQLAWRLSPTGEIDSATARALNVVVSRANPGAIAAFEGAYRVRGSLRDVGWKGKGRATVQVFEKGLRGLVPLGERTSFANGFFDIGYEAPRTPAGKAKNRLHILVRITPPAGPRVERVYHNVGRIHWANFTDGDQAYRGDSRFTILDRGLTASLDRGVTLETIEESGDTRDVTYLSANTGAVPDDVMKVSLAYRIASNNGGAALTPEVFYAFLSQNYPPELPSDLQPDTPAEWRPWMDAVTEDAAVGIALLERDSQERILDDALEANLVSREVLLNKDAILAEFDALRRDFVLEKPILDGGGNLKALLGLANVPVQLHHRIADIFVTHWCVGNEFWHEVSRIEDLAVGELKQVADLGRLTANQVEAIQGLLDRIADVNQPERTLQDFAKWRLNDWESFVRDQGDHVPKGTPGNTAAEQRSAFATEMKNRSEELFPAVALMAEAKNSPSHGLEHLTRLTQVIDEHPEIDLAQVNLDRFNADPSPAAHLSDAQLSELKLLQRVHRLAPGPITATRLLEANLHSAVQVYSYGRDRLAKKLGVDDREAKAIWERAKYRHAKGLALLGEYRMEFHRDTPRAIQSFVYDPQELEDAAGDIPNLDVLFGSLDYCDCRHCQSVYSPAAYLTDLLRFLGEKDAVAGNRTARDVLLDRRPDIKNIKLSCENTETPVPYIDLACEILENWIVSGNTNVSYQTTLPAEQLRAVSEYVDPDAYDQLRSAEYPMGAPLNLWQEEARVFLDHLGVPRHELMCAFQNRSDASVAKHAPSMLSIAGEYFGIPPHSLELIVNQADGTKARQDALWGITNSGARSQPVATLLARAQLHPDEGYYQLRELLQCQFVNPEASQSTLTNLEACDVEAQVVDHLGFGKLDRMHRFVRLWHAVTWQMWELDRLIQSPGIGKGRLDASCLENLYRVAKLQKRLHLSAEDLSVFYGPISTEARTSVRASVDAPVPSHFDRLFQNVATTHPINPALAFGALAGRIADQRATVQAALFVTDRDLDDLLSLSLIDGELTLDNLSILFRHATLARAMRLSIDDLCRLLFITGTDDPFSTPGVTLRLLELHEDIQGFGASLRSLEYALSGDTESPLGVREETLKQWAQGLRTNLATVRQSDSASDEEQGSRARVQPALQALREIEVIPAASDIARMLDLVEGSWADSEPQRLAFIAEHFGPFVRDLAAAQALLTSEPGLDDDGKTARFGAVIAELRSFRVLNSVRDHVASITGLEAEKAAVIIGKVAVPNSAAKIGDVLRDPSLTDTDSDGSFVNSLDPTGMPDLYASYRMLHRISALLEGVEVETEDLSWFIDNHATAGTLDFDRLPNVGGAVLPFHEWRDLRRHLAFIKRFPEPEETSFRQILSMIATGTALSEVWDALSILTEWDRTDLATLHAELGIANPSVASDYLRAETYARLRRCFEQMRRTGVNASTAVRWAKRDVHADEGLVARETREAAKSKYDDVRWLEVAPDLHDTIREKKRVGLVAYTVEASQRNEPMTVDDGNGNHVPNPLVWRKPDDIHRYLLIDGLMTACQPTSRIKLAISAVQLFIQRCIDGLEERYVRPADHGGVARANSWKQWHWLKSYRIWEANRKVFLYPENWIEPELRDDKTPFFKDLENELLGGEITEETVEAAFRSYLQKVDDVAHLEICGLYHEATAETNRMHVVGHTRGVPASYFHRHVCLHSSTWSPWQKIDVEIEGNHVTPVVYNRRLHLFWLTFEEKPLKTKRIPKSQVSSSTQEAPEAPVMLQVRLGWTSKTHEGWSAKRIARQKLINPWKRPEHSYNLRPRYKRVDNSLWLDVFVSTSKAFNDATFYDQHKGHRVRLTDVPFHETFRPWHAASFVFDGDLVDMRLRGLAGTYFLPDKSRESYTNSFEYVRQNFEEESGGRINRLRPHQPSLALPSGMHFEYRYLTNNRFHAKNDRRLEVLDNDVSRSVLRRAPTPFRVVETQQETQLGRAARLFVYQDRNRAFLVRPEYRQLLADCRTRVQRRAFEFNPLYHPYAGLFIRELNRGGVDGLLRRDLQTSPASFPPRNTFDFAHYEPADLTKATASGTKDVVDFDLSGAYGVYNWEIFCHAPLMIASMLNRNQKFAGAMKWFHYIFDPTSTEADPVPQRYWITKPFYENNGADYKRQRVRSILEQVGAFDDAVTAWKDDPFKPHLVARYRPVAYQRAVVMKYIDNLIDWGDQLFRRDSIESINEATLRYLLAKELLGDRPTRVPSLQRSSFSFAELDANELDIFANTQVAVVADHLAQPPVQVPPAREEESEPLPILSTLYFCIPCNDRLDAYWDRVADRLFKIRNCMNIEGVGRQLPLFEPPIDPALLVKAAAAGVDLTSVLDDLSAPLPPYRFEVMVQQARRLVGEVRSLGGLLLSALEKKDADELAVLRADHQEDLLKATRTVRQFQIREATQQAQGLNENRSLVEQRHEFYASREYMNPWEITATALEASSLVSHGVATNLDFLSGSVAVVPNFTVGAAGVGGTAVATIEQGGQGMSKASERAASALYQIAAILSKAGGMAATQGGYRRRMDDWSFQAQQARQELQAVDRQIAAAEIRVAIAERELANLDLQIEQASMEHEYLRTKYTNQQLYGWMLGQLSSLYFQSYQLAFDAAKRAERCYQYELEQPRSSFVTFGYWDGLRKGLLAGERLSQSLDRLEAAYRDRNRREYEITKRISLAEVAPLSLLKLKYTGECTLNLEESFFDLDYPGHYMRRVKSAAVTVPAVVGPYTSLNCTVTIEASEIRVDNTVPGGRYERATQGTDSRFRDQVVAVRSMVTSHGQGDTGVFELRLADERYLPFECAGAIGRWRIRLPQNDNQFDVGTITDFILTLQYTAREGGQVLRSAAEKHRDDVAPKSGETMLSLRHHFPTEWHRFLHPAKPGDDQVLRLKLRREHFPFFVRGRQPRVASIQLAAESTHAGDYDMQVTLPGHEARDSTMKRSAEDPAEFGDLHVPAEDIGFHEAPPVAYGEWSLKLKRHAAADFASLAGDEIEDVFLLIAFQLS